MLKGDFYQPRTGGAILIVSWSLIFCNALSTYSALFVRHYPAEPKLNVQQVPRRHHLRGTAARAPLQPLRHLRATSIAIVWRLRWHFYPERWVKPGPAARACYSVRVLVSQERLSPSCQVIRVCWLLA
jgi:hypothetical protein